MSDYISRQAAIDAFRKELATGEVKGKYVTICSAISFTGAKHILEALPSADVRENVRGEWIKPIRKMTGDRPDYECSVCHHWFIWGDNIHLKFCPNCGADMRGDNNG